MKRSARSRRWTRGALIAAATSWVIIGLSFAINGHAHSRAVKLTVMPGELWLSWTSHPTSWCRAFVYGNGGGPVIFDRGGVMVIGFPISMYRGPFWLPRLYPILPKVMGFHAGEYVAMMPLWIPAAVPTCGWSVLWWRGRRASTTGRCTSCGYDRRSLPVAAVCPECGSGTKAS